MFLRFNVLSICFILCSSEFPFNLNLNDNDFEFSTFSPQISLHSQSKLLIDGHTAYLLAIGKLFEYEFNRTLNQFEMKRHINLPSDENSLKMCNGIKLDPFLLKMKKEEELIDPCENYLTQIIRRPLTNDLVVCGTNSLQPRHYVIEGKRFELSKEEEGIGLCSYLPFSRHKTILHWTNITNPQFKQIYFAGGFTDLFRSDSVIFRSHDENGNFLRSPQYDSFILHDPKFLKILERKNDDDFIYLFFIETDSFYSLPVENERVSRIARLCRNDIGYGESADRIWYSLRKMKIICRSNNHQFDILENVERIDENYFIGIFSSRQSSQMVQCIFSWKDIDEKYSNNKNFLQKTNKLSFPSVRKSEEEINSCDDYDSGLKNGEFYSQHVMLDGEIINIDLEELLTEDEKSISNNMKLNLEKNENLLQIRIGKLSRNIYILTDKQIHRLLFDYDEEGKLKVYSIPSIRPKLMENEHCVTMDIYYSNFMNEEYLIIASNKRLISIDLSTLCDRSYTKFNNCFLCQLDKNCHWESDLIVTSSHNQRIDSSLSGRCVTHQTTRSECSIESSKMKINLLGDVTSINIIDCLIQNDNVLLHWENNKCRWIINDQYYHSISSQLIEKEFGKFIESSNSLVLLTINSTVTIRRELEWQKNHFIPFNSFVISPNQLIGKDESCQCITNRTIIDKYHEWCSDIEKYQRRRIQWVDDIRMKSLEYCSSKIP
ncbi:hypothetical protein SNEBB_010097 [Seison nebaliae]|nr:hypothetical protein SNEBB_010097 [Seison nebaliae]